MRDYRHSFGIMFPYCFKLDKEGYVLAAFNREYQYIPRGILRFTRKPSTFKGIWHINDGDCLYMWGGFPDSRKAYFKRLEKLLSHSHEVLEDKTVNIMTIEDIGYVDNRYPW